MKSKQQTIEETSNKIWNAGDKLTHNELDKIISDSLDNYVEGVIPPKITDERKIYSKEENELGKKVMGVAVYSRHLCDIKLGFNECISTLRHNAGLSK